ALRGAQRPETGRRLLREVRGPLEGRGRRAPARRPRGAGPAGATGARAGNVSGAPEWDRGVLIAANRATVYGTIGRGLMRDARAPHALAVCGHTRLVPHPRGAQPGPSHFTRRGFAGPAGYASRLDPP